MTENVRGSSRLQIVLNNYAMFGFWQTFKDVLKYWADHREDHFDLIHGTDTSGLVMPDATLIPDEHARENAVHYEPTDAMAFQHIVRCISRTVDLSGWSFIDIGCGRGRTLLYASHLPFREITGVEISSQHAEIAQKNVAQYLRKTAVDVRCPKISVVCRNAVNIELPTNGNILIYMYRPFYGPIFNEVANRISALKAGTHCRILIAFLCPAESYLLEHRKDYARLMIHEVITMQYSWSLWECTA